ncbi:MAG: hypothetical protein JWL85_632 [Candidatus Saccharibacteria bacterium]|nr:hypothetical protein [Candidatus Saccharibacteria bacterium]
MEGGDYGPEGQPPLPHRRDGEDTAPVDPAITRLTVVAEQLKTRNKELARDSAIFQSVAERLLHFSEIDPSTGLHEQLYWRASLETLISAGEQNFGVIFVRMMNPARIYAELGTEQGDQAIQLATSVVQEKLRHNGESNGPNPMKDLLVAPHHEGGRYDSGDFAILCELSSSEERQPDNELRLQKITTRLREAINEALNQHPELRERGFNLAIGAAIFERDMSSEELLTKADRLLRQDEGSIRFNQLNMDQLRFIQDHKGMMQRILTDMGVAIEIPADA